MSKNLHLAQVFGSFATPVDINVPVFTGQFDVALLLSEIYGRNIRQGHNFRLRGYGIQLEPRGIAANLEGAAVSCELGYCPSTMHAVKAWEIAKSRWMKFKQLEGRAGRNVRYDDFECAFNSTFINARTSNIRSQGIGDLTEEQFIIFGDSIDNVSYSLEDYYASSFPQKDQSVDPFTGIGFKDAKFLTKFPSPQSLTCTSKHTIHLNANNAGTGDIVSGGDAQGNIQLLPDDTHVNIMCGLMSVKVFSVMQTTGIQTPDNFNFTISLYLEGWSPLRTTGGRKKKGGRSRKSASRKKR